MRSVLGVHWKDWCWSWNSNTLATSCEEMTHWKRLWCWEGLRAGGEGDNRGWDDWMASPTQWTWVWVGDGQGGLACCNSWGCKESNTTERLNWGLRSKMISPLFYIQGNWLSKCLKTYTKVTLVVSGQAGIQVHFGCLQIYALFIDPTCFSVLL